MQNSEPRQPNQCARYLLHISGANWCPQPSSVVSIYINNQLFVPVRSVLPNKKKGSSALLSLPRYEVPGMLFFSDCTEIYLFPTTNQHQFMRQIIFHSVRSNALWGGGGGLRHALTEAGSSPPLFSSYLRRSVAIFSTRVNIHVSTIADEQYPSVHARSCMTDIAN